MPKCPNCGATVPEGAIACGNCGFSLGFPQATTTPIPYQSPPSSSQSPSGSSTWPSRTDDNQPSARLEKALRRTEQLSYAVLGLGLAILIVIIVISALP